MSDICPHCKQRMPEPLPLMKMTPEAVEKVAVDMAARKDEGYGYSKWTSPGGEAFSCSYREGEAGCQYRINGELVAEKYWYDALREVAQ